MSIVRIQRKRTKGWRMPEGAVYVGRGSEWGNPVRVGTEYEPDPIRPDAGLEPRRFRSPMTAQDAVDWYRQYAIARAPWGWIAPLRTATALACWCPLDQPCHADVLIELLETPR